MSTLKDFVNKEITKVDNVCKKLSKEREEIKNRLDNLKKRLEEIEEEEINVRNYWGSLNSIVNNIHYNEDIKKLLDKHEPKVDDAIINIDSLKKLHEKQIQPGVMPWYPTPWITPTQQPSPQQPIPNTIWCQADDNKGDK